MFGKLPHLPFLFQENSAERREILGHTPSHEHSLGVSGGLLISIP
jgi:hypothetical protein